MHRRILPPLLAVAALTLLTGCAGASGSAPESHSGASSPAASASPSGPCDAIAADLQHMSASGTAAFTALMQGKTADALKSTDDAQASADHVLAQLPGVSAEDKAAYLSTFASLRDVIHSHADTPIPQESAAAAIAPVTAKSSEAAVASATSHISVAYDTLCPNAAGATADPSASPPASHPASDSPAASPAASGSGAAPGQ